MHPIKPTVPRCDVEKLVVGSELEKNTGADCVYKLRGSGIDVNATYRAKPPFLWKRRSPFPVESREVPSRVRRVWADGSIIWGLWGDVGGGRGSGGLS